MFRISNRFSYVIFAIVLALHSGQILAQDNPFHLKIYAEELPPFNFMQGGTVEGISTDVLIRIMEKAGNPIQRSLIEIVPWTRGYLAVQVRPNCMLYSMARTRHREKLFKWVGPIISLTIGLVSLKSKHLQIESVDDLKKYRIGSVRDGAPEQLVVAHGINKKSLDRVSKPELNIKKLNTDRIDLFAFNIPTSFYLIQKMGLDPNDYQVVYVLQKADLYYAFHIDTDDAFISALNRALVELKQVDSKGKSEFDRIKQNYKRILDAIQPAHPKTSQVRPFLVR